ncbi:MAG TPA: hypothetical protein VG297_10260 [Bryobacteraceae bacterium]|jgi:hypothetical protein|nr:hypothetical protein [Bryobacteraceae bacterium]
MGSAGTFRSELSALAIATTIYHEASPDMMEEARLRYSLAVDRFRAAQSGHPDAESGRETSGTTDSESQPLA